MAESGKSPNNLTTVASDPNQNTRVLARFTPLATFLNLLNLPIIRTITGLIRNPFHLFRTVITRVWRFSSLILKSYVRPNDPLHDVTEFIQDFNRVYSDNHFAFHAGSYGTALNEAKRNIRFLLVYLHSPSHSNTDKFCRETMLSDELTGLLNQYNVLLWGVSVRTLEGMRVSRIMHENTYPFLALILLRNQRMEVVERFEGYQPTNLFLERLRPLLELQENQLIVARNEIETRLQNRLLRDEQDREYQDSVAADMERKRVQEELKEREIREKEEENQRVEEAKAKRERVQRRRSELEVYFTENTTDPKDSKAVQVRFRLPNTSPVSRWFLKSDKVNLLYDFVFSSQNSPDNFQIAMNLPRKVLYTVRDGDSTLEDIGISQSCTLFVEDLDT